MVNEVDITRLHGMKHWDHGEHTWDMILSLSRNAPREMNEVIPEMAGGSNFMGILRC